MDDINSRAVVQHAGHELFVAISATGHAQVLDANHDRNSAPTPMELLLMALGTCTAVDVVEILRKKRERVTDYHVEVRGWRRQEHPRAYTMFEVRHFLRGHALSEKAVAQAIELSDTKYCSVAATLRPAAEIVTSYEITEEQVPAQS